MWTSTEAAVVTGGENTQDWAATGVCVRAQDVRPGDLFVASEGEDLKKAMRKGAVAAVVSHISDDLDIGMPLLKVASGYDALRDLARAARFRSHATVMAVQGRPLRAMVTQAFDMLGHVHDGGRILSLGMANMPEDFDFGVFALAPPVRPDIAVITDGVGISERLFENMPRGGFLIINRDCPAFLPVVARARAAGIENIFSFGLHTGADARIVEHLEAANGMRVIFNILGDEFSMVFNGDIQKARSALGILLAVKLCGRNIRHVARLWQAGNVLRPDTGMQSVSLIEATPGSIHTPSRQAAFRVQNLIDLGFGRQTAILDNIVFPENSCHDVQKNDLVIPRRIANLDFVYTSKGLTTVSNAHNAIKTMHQGVRVETIVPEVLAPGDFLVFNQKRKAMKATMADTLRLKAGRKIREKGL